MAPLAIGLFGVVVGAVALFMSFSNGSKITALQSSVSDAAQAASDAKTTAASAAGLSAKVDATSSKLDAFVAQANDVLTKYGQAIADDTTKLNTLTENMGKSSKATAKGGAESKVVPGQGGTHTIAAGDTLSNVAKKYNVSLKAIEDANPGVDSSHLKIGQSITIPASRGSSGASSAPAPRDMTPAPAPAPAPATAT
jgi:LysM repeat protein